MRNCILFWNSLFSCTSRASFRGLSALGAAGLSALDYLDKSEPAPESWRTQQLALIERRKRKRQTCCSWWWHLTRTASATAVLARTTMSNRSAFSVFARSMRRELLRPPRFRSRFRFIEISSADQASRSRAERSSKEARLRAGEKTVPKEDAISHHCRARREGYPICTSAVRS